MKPSKPVLWAKGVSSCSPKALVHIAYYCVGPHLAIGHIAVSDSVRVVRVWSRPYGSIRRIGNPAHGFIHEISQIPQAPLNLYAEVPLQLRKGFLLNCLAYLFGVETQPEKVYSGSTKLIRKINLALFPVKRKQGFLFDAIKSKDSARLVTREVSFKNNRFFFDTFG